MLFQLQKAVANALNIRLPKAMNAPGGVARPAMYGSTEKQITIDLLLPTIESMTARRPDLKVKLAGEERILYF